MNIRNIFTALAFTGLMAVIIFKFMPDTTAANTSFQNTPKTENAKDPIQLDVIARVGPWPYASRLIGYRGRLWFANSVKFRNHNSSDIWSLNPLTLEKKLERNLFSQDAGTPLIHKDLLYWPLEDALLAGGNGEITATDGEAWQSYVIDTATIYHTSELHDWKGGLLAITGARNAGLQTSHDGGRSWKELYDHPTPDTHISRIRDMVMLHGQTYATLRDDKKQRLVTWTGSGFEPVKGWPKSRPVRALTVHKNAIYALVGKAGIREIWKYDGHKAENLNHQNAFTDLTSDGDNLWTVTSTGHLYSFSQNNKWSRHRDLKNGTPMEIAAISGAIYVAGAGDDKRGIIWGPSKHNIVNNQTLPVSSPQAQYPIEPNRRDWNIIGIEIDTILSDANTYKGRRNGKLSQLMQEAVIYGAPIGFFEKRLQADIPDIKISTFGGNLETKASDISATMILRNMAKSGHANVPPEFLKPRWTAPQNSYEKYLSVPLSALKAITETGQNDKATIAALIARLDYNDDPDWFKSQVIGTLTAVTHQHHGYDIKAWKTWHQNNNR